MPSVVYPRARPTGKRKERAANPSEGQLSEIPMILHARDDLVHSDQSFRSRPGPQPWNAELAPTLEEQLARASRLRPARPLSLKAARRIVATIQAHRDVLRFALLDILAEDIGIIVARILRKRRTQDGQ